MFNDISCGTRDNEREYLANARLVSLYARKFGKGQWSFIGSGSEKKWYSMKEDSPPGIWENLEEKMLIEFAESGCPTFRAMTPLSRGQLKSKGHGKLSIHFAVVQVTIETYFSHYRFWKTSSVFTEQSRRCVKNMKPFTTDRSDLMMWWSNQLCSVRSRQKFLWRVMTQRIKIFLFQQNEERIEKLSQQEKLSKFCMDAGFLSVVEVGQYFVTKDTGDLTQFNAVVCREYTLPRDDGSSQPRGWIQGNTKIGPVLEVTIQPVICTVNMELRSELCLWAETILTPGLEFLMDQINLWWIRTTTTQKFLKISLKNKRYN